MRTPKNWLRGAAAVLDPPTPPVEIRVEPDPEPETVEVPMTEIHPAGLLCCLSHYFNMKYDEMPPHIQQTQLLDGMQFTSTWNSQTREITLLVWKDPFGNKQKIFEKSFPLACFDKVYLEVPE